MDEIWQDPEFGVLDDSLINLFDFELFVFIGKFIPFNGAQRGVSNVNDMLH